MKKTDHESIVGAIVAVQMEINIARDGDFDDVLNVCESLLNLIERLNDREMGQ